MAHSPYKRQPSRDRDRDHSYSILSDTTHNDHGTIISSSCLSTSSQKSFTKSRKIDAHEHYYDFDTLSLGMIDIESIVQTPYGWGAVREMKVFEDSSSTDNNNNNNNNNNNTNTNKNSHGNHTHGNQIMMVTVRLPWGMVTLLETEIMKKSILPLGQCVLCHMGITGIIVDYRITDGMYLIRFFNRYGSPGTMLGYMNEKSIIKPLKAAVGLQIVTPCQSGKVIRYVPERDEYLVKFDDDDDDMMGHHMQDMDILLLQQQQQQQQPQDNSNSNSNSNRRPLQHKMSIQEDDHENDSSCSSGKDENEESDKEKKLQMTTKELPKHIKHLHEMISKNYNTLTEKDLSVINDNFIYAPKARIAPLIESVMDKLIFLKRQDQIRSLAMEMEIRSKRVLEEVKTRASLEVTEMGLDFNKIALELDEDMDNLKKDAEEIIQKSKKKMSLSNTSDGIIKKADGEDVLGEEMNATEVYGKVTNKMKHALESETATTVLSKVEREFKEKLKSTKASDIVNEGRNKLLKFLNNKESEQNNNNNNNNIDNLNISLSGESHPLDNDDEEEDWNIWELLGGEGSPLQIMTSINLKDMLEGQWKILKHMSEDDHRMKEMMDEVELQWIMLNKTQRAFQKSTTVMTLIVGLAKLEGRFDEIVDGPEFEFLRHRGIKFLSNVLSNTTAVSKAKDLFDAAQNKVEKEIEGKDLKQIIQEKVDAETHKVEEIKGSPNSLKSLASSNNAGSSVKEMFGLQILVDLEKELRENLQGLKTLSNGLDAIKNGGFEENALSDAEDGILFLYNLARPPTHIPDFAINREKKERNSIDMKELNQNMQELFSTIGAPAVLREITQQLATKECTLAFAVQKIIRALESDEMINIAKELIEKGDEVLDKLVSFKDNPAMKGILMNIAGSDLETKFIDNIENWDIDEIMGEAELLMSDATARETLINQITDKALEFLLEYLPSMPIPSISGLNESVEYTVSGLDMSGFKLLKEDVDINFYDLDNNEGDGDLLVVNVKNITAEFFRFNWEYEQLYFPYMKGKGLADAFVKNATIRLSFRVKKKEVVINDENTFFPVLVLSSKFVDIENLKVKVDESKIAWLYNLLASIFASSIKFYICRTLTDTLVENMSELLSTLNVFAKDSWPLISKIANAKLEELPLISEEEKLELELYLNSQKELEKVLNGHLGETIKLTPYDLDVELTSNGSIGLDIDVDDAKKALVITGIMPEGLTAKALPRQVTRSSVIGTYIVAINKRDISNLPPSRALTIIKSIPRPFSFRIRFKSTRGIRSLSNAAEAGSVHDILGLIKITFEDPDLGIRFKASTSLAETLVVNGLQRGPNDEIRAAEKSGQVHPGQILVAINNDRLQNKKRQDIVPLLKNPIRPICLTFCDSPDVEVLFENFMDVKLTPFDKFLVVTGFLKRPGPLELLGRLRTGDMVVSCNEHTYPTQKGLREDVSIMREAEVPIKLKFFRPSTRQEIDVVLDEKPERWGVTWSASPDKRPMIKNWSGIIGDAKKVELVTPGNMVVIVNDVPVSKLLEKYSAPKAVEVLTNLQLPCKMVFRSGEMHSMWKKYNP